MGKLSTDSSPGATLLRSLAQEWLTLRPPAWPFLRNLLEWPDPWTERSLAWTARNLDLALRSIDLQSDRKERLAQLVGWLASEPLLGLAVARCLAQLMRARLPAKLLPATAWPEAFVEVDHRDARARVRVATLCGTPEFAATHEFLGALRRSLSEEALLGLAGTTLEIHCGPSLDLDKQPRRPIWDPATRGELLSQVAEGVTEWAGWRKHERAVLYAGPGGRQLGERLADAEDLASPFDKPWHGRTGGWTQAMRQSLLSVELHRDPGVPEGHPPIFVSRLGLDSSRWSDLVREQLRGWYFVGGHQAAPHDILFVDCTEEEHWWGRGTRLFLDKLGDLPATVVGSSHWARGHGVPPRAAKPHTEHDPLRAYEVSPAIQLALERPLPFEAGELPCAPERFRAPPEPLAVPGTAYLGGSFAAAGEGDEEVLARSPGDIEDALGRVQVAPHLVFHAQNFARAALESWAATPAEQRLAALRRLRDVLAGHQDDVARTLMRSAGAPAWEARAEAAALPAAIDTALPQLERALTDPSGGRAGEWLNRHRGHLEILPPARPALLWAHCQVISAVALGHPVLCFSPVGAPHAGAHYAACVDEAGWPKGVFNLVHPYEDNRGLMHRASHRQGLAFAGPRREGLELAIAAHPDDVLFLDLGGENLAFVLDDADIESAARAVLRGALASAGQRLSSTTECYLPPGLRKGFDRALFGISRELRAGHWGDEAAYFGPLASAEALRECQKAGEQHARFADEGPRLGPWVYPTVSDDRRGYYVSPFIYRPRVDMRGLEALTLTGPHLRFCELREDQDAPADIAHRIAPRVVSIHTASRERFEALAATLHVPFVFHNRPTSDACELLPRFPILPQRLLEGVSTPRAPGSDLEGWPKPQLPAITRE